MESGEAVSEKIRIVGISFSPRAGKTTAAALAIALEAARAESAAVETDLVELAGLSIDGDVAAGLPPKPGMRDDFPSLVERISGPAVAGWIVGTPVYMGGATSLGRAFLERCSQFRKDNYALRNRVAGCLSVGGARNGGQELAVMSVLTALLYQQMVVVGSGDPAGHFGGTVLNDGKDSVAQDEFGLVTARAVGKRVAQVALKIAGRA